MSVLFNKTKSKYLRRYLRNASTDTERTLWKCLSRDQLGTRFRRQYGVGRYIVDFYAPQQKLVIEVDGGYHFDNEKQMQYDQIRQNELESLGLKVIRFTNSEINDSIEGVVDKIKSHLRSF